MDQQNRFENNHILDFGTDIDVCIWFNNNDVFHFFFSSQSWSQLAVWVAIPTRVKSHLTFEVWVEIILQISVTLTYKNKSNSFGDLFWAAIIVKSWVDLQLPNLINPNWLINHDFELPIINSTTHFLLSMSEFWCTLCVFWGGVKGQSLFQWPGYKCGIFVHRYDRRQITSLLVVIPNLFQPINL